MNFINLDEQYKLIKEEVKIRINSVLDHGKFIMGPEVFELEEKLADYNGVTSCISCSSGTDALLMVLLAWGIKKGDAVFTPAFTFIATAEVIKLIGATPVFVDIEKDTFNIDCEKLEKKIVEVKTKRHLIPKVIIPVDLFGLPSNYNQISKIADKYNLLVLEDGAQSFGANINNEKTGSFGNAACTSFFPAKPLGAYGDGGAIFTNDSKLAKILDSIRSHGKGEDRYDNVRIGINGRLDTLQAAIILVKMKLIDEELIKRKLIATKYNEYLEKYFVTPKFFNNVTSAWAQYTLLAKCSEHRQYIVSKLKENNVPVMIYYPIPLHLQKVFSELNYKKGDLPVSEDYSERVFSLPICPYTKNNDIEHIIKILTTIENKL